VIFCYSIDGDVGACRGVLGNWWRGWLAIVGMESRHRRLTSMSKMTIIGAESSSFAIGIEM
jgi:hypothetical protein